MAHWKFPKHTHCYFISEYWVLIKHVTHITFHSLTRHQFFTCTPSSIFVYLTLSQLVTWTRPRRRVSHRCPVTQDQSKARSSEQVEQRKTTIELRFNPTAGAEPNTLCILGCERFFFIYFILSAMWETDLANWTELECCRNMMCSGYLDQENKE